MPEDITLGELNRRFDALERRISEEFSKLATKESIASQDARTGDRIDTLERDLRTATAAIEALTKALETERENRAAEIKAEAKAREDQVEKEKIRVGVWFRWVFGSVAVAIGTAIANALGLHIG